MNRMLLKILVGVALSMIFVVSVQAASINGSIGFGGTYTQNGGTHGNLATAISMSISSTTILSATGDLAGATTPLTFASPIGVNGNGPSLLGTNLWSVTVGSYTYSLNVSTETQTSTTSETLVLQGTGIIHSTDTSKSDTYGNWQLSFGANGESFTWQSTSNSVPEPSSLYLLGMGILGLFGYGLKRRG